MPIGGKIQKKKENLGIKPGSGTKCDSQPQSIQFLLSSRSPIRQMTQQLNVELLMNTIQTCQLSRTASVSVGRVSHLSAVLSLCFLYSRVKNSLIHFGDGFSYDPTDPILP